MSLIQSAKLNGHDPYAYLKDVLERLPAQRASEIDALPPHRWWVARHLILPTPRTSGQVNMTSLAAHEDSE